VLFDGGAGGNGNRGGRDGLRSGCQTAKQKLALPQTATEAVISLSEGDQLLNMPEHFHFARKSPHVVSPLGIEFAPNWDAIWNPAGTPTSLICAGIMAPNVETWLTGTSNSTSTAIDPLNPMFGLYEFAVGEMPISKACSEWTLGDHDPDIQGRIGSSKAMLDAGPDGYPYFVRYSLVSCEGANDHVLCIAFNPLP